MSSTFYQESVGEKLILLLPSFSFQNFKTNLITPTTLYFLVKLSGWFFWEKKTTTMEPSEYIYHPLTYYNWFILKKYILYLVKKKHYICDFLPVTEPPRWVKELHI